MHFKKSAEPWKYFDINCNYFIILCVCALYLDINIAIATIRYVINTPPYFYSTYVIYAKDRISDLRRFPNDLHCEIAFFDHEVGTSNMAAGDFLSVIGHQLA